MAARLRLVMAAARCRSTVPHRQFKCVPFARALYKIIFILNYVGLEYYTKGFSDPSDHKQIALPF